MKKRPLVGKKLFIGGSEWAIFESGDKRMVEAFKMDLPDGLVPFGQCLIGNRQILIRKGLEPQVRFETLMHEGIHAILSEHDSFPAFIALSKSEELVHMFTKSLVSYLRQLQDHGVIGD